MLNFECRRRRLEGGSLRQDHSEDLLTFPIAPLVQSYRVFAQAGSVAMAVSALAMRKPSIESLPMQMEHALEL